MNGYEQVLHTKAKAPSRPAEAVSQIYLPRSSHKLAKRTYLEGPEDAYDRNGQRCTAFAGSLLDYLITQDPWCWRILPLLTTTRLVITAYP